MRSYAFFVPHRILVHVVERSAPVNQPIITCSSVLTRLVWNEDRFDYRLVDGLIAWGELDVDE